ncbi:hypothetical protein, partial [Klebsiella michiganensis]
MRLLPRLRCAYPDYESAAVCGPVARVRRLRRNPGMYRDKYIDAVSSRVALRLPGPGVHRRLRAGRYCERLQPFLVADTFSGSRMTGTPTTALSGAV